MAADLYETLGIQPSADQKTIAAAYRRLVFEHHPDRNSSDHATAKTAEINHAYRILSDPSSRAEYDKNRARDDIPRAILGTSKLMLYDIQTVKPRHRHILWQDGIWHSIMDQFGDCQARHCLVLLQIEPGSGRQIYQHGDPGPKLNIDPNAGEFRLLKPWLDECHQADDAVMAASTAAAR
ncbi:MAG TPA: J domain-containing protein [Chloroflexota bacterium]|nr:J domain-containing protein [Chloroflexota bacterium]